MPKSSKNALTHKGSKNALTHGVYAQEVVLPWEHAQAFDNLHEELRRDLKPSGFLQATADAACVFA
jgi:hypothetical protein